MRFILFLLNGFSGIGVRNPQMIFPVQKRLVFMLAVNIDQNGRCFLQSEIGTVSPLILLTLLPAIIRLDKVTIPSSG